ncbi:ComEA family DNA-binding protein [Vibrio brasiliensis]
MLKQLLLVTLLLSFPAITQAEDASTDAKYQGIEITVNINQASAEELADLLLGIGLAKAQAIVEFRQLNGHFTSAEDLKKVKGIGAAIVAQNRDRIKL